MVKGQVDAENTVVSRIKVLDLKPLPEPPMIQVAVSPHG